MLHEHLIIRREITATGKSSSRINGQLVNMTMLRKTGEWLVNIHGQHEHQSLLHVDEHIHSLDLFGDAEIESAKTAYQASYDQYMKLQKELNDFKKRASKRCKC